MRKYWRKRKLKKRGTQGAEIDRERREGKKNREQRGRDYEEERKRDK